MNQGTLVSCHIPLLTLVYTANMFESIVEIQILRKGFLFFRKGNAIGDASWMYDGHVLIPSGDAGPSPGLEKAWSGHWYLPKKCPVM